MSSMSDAVPVSETQTYSSAPLGLTPAERTEALDFHQEINERRARIENAELLQHLRGSENPDHGCHPGFREAKDRDP